MVDNSDEDNETANYIFTLQDYKNQFQSEYGKLFARQVLDLFEFINSVYVVGAMFNNFKGFMKLITSKEFIEGMSSLIPNSKNLKPSEQLRIKEIMVESEEIPDNETLASRISDIDDPQMFKYMMDNLRSSDYETDFEDLLNQYDINPRVNAYYFIGLNVYLENYIKSLYKYVLENCVKDQRVDLANFYRDRSNSSPRLKSLLLANSKSIQNQFDKTHSQEIRIEFLKLVKNINDVRNDIAHSDPNMKNTVISEKFPIIAAEAEKEISKQKIDLFEMSSTNENEFIKEFQEKLTSIFTNIINDLDSSFIIRRITDNLIQALLKFDQLLISLYSH